ncbi:MAG: flagellar basal body rod protein FlgC [Bacteroidota bacterium]|nr:flagellar basal body rod protein FlgC [Bacteroidota bacterium]
MKIGGNFSGFDISSKGLSVQRKKMNLIAENIANADALRTENGEPYKRKFLKVSQTQSPFKDSMALVNTNLEMQATNGDHLKGGQPPQLLNNDSSNGMAFNEVVDQKEGETIYMPSHPNADEKGYVKMSNVNIINEMVDMIAATRSYEANLTAFNSSKQIAKDSLEI